jgi:hypothetical protein
VPRVGHATLRRAQYGHFSLTLTLDVDVAKALPTGNGATEITLPGPAPAHQRSFSARGDLRALLLEHRLLHRPELLRAPRPEVSVGDCADALEGLRHTLVTTVARPSGYGHIRCPKCPTAPAPRTSVGFYGYNYAQPSGEDCAHVALFPKALAALMDAHPELTFELADLLTPDVDAMPTRYVLTGTAMQRALLSWLLPGKEHARSRRAYVHNAWDLSGYGRARPKKPRPTAPRAAWEGVSEAQRVGLTFAARAWQCEADAPRFALRPEGAVPVAPWRPADAVTALDLAVLLPDEFRVPAPTPPRAAPTPRAPAAPAAAPAKKLVKRAAKTAPPAATAPAPQAPPTPATLLTMKDLAALGHSAAEVKKLLKSGALERESFGWYRFAKR